MSLFPKPIAHHGDCLEKLSLVEDSSIDLIYLDPPFFTQETQRLSDRISGKEYRFEDIWSSQAEYGNFILKRLKALKLKLKETGSIFVHCDRKASHLIRTCLDTTFGYEHFQSEIIWHYKRWSNSKDGLLPSHQNIYFYSVGKKFKFNKIFSNYSPTTNVDQIVQRRTRNEINKSSYARDSNGNVITSEAKKGVPIGDVWEIPYLNPKAKERTGYPTQKPLILLERIITLVTNEGDIVLYPFCGSGTTLIAAMLLGRESIGIDTSKDAISVTLGRIENPIKSESNLLKKGKEVYNQHDRTVAHVMSGIEYTPIQRNKGIDGLLKQTFKGSNVFFRVQRNDEGLFETVGLIKRAIKNKGKCVPVVISTQMDVEWEDDYINGVLVVKSTGLFLKRKLFYDQESSKRSYRIDDLLFDYGG